MSIRMQTSIGWSLLALAVGLQILPGCRNPGQSSLPPSAISPAACCPARGQTRPGAAAAALGLAVIQYVEKQVNSLACAGCGNGSSPCRRPSA